MKHLKIYLLLISLFPLLINAQQKSEYKMLSLVKTQLANDYSKSEIDALQLKINDYHKSKQSQLEHYYFRQNQNGIEIYGTESSIHLKPDGSVFKFNNRLLKTAKSKVSTPSINAVQAVQAAGKHLGYPTINNLQVLEHSSFANRKQTISKANLSRRTIPAKLVYTKSGTGSLSLAWEVSIYEIQKEEWWSLQVDANSGEVLHKDSWIVHCNFDHGNGAHVCSNHNTKTKHSTTNFLENNEETTGSVGGYRVYPMPLAHAGEGNRSLINNPDNAIASPFGWHDTNGAAGAEFTTTRGNNVHAYDDGNNAGYSADGGAGLIFDFPLDLSQDPELFEDAGLTNLFYWNNIAHDVLYQYGFDEASGNFQQNNYGNSGASGDYVNARSQVGLLCNATFGTPPDGTRPTMSMYICNGRDGDYSNAVILHEYAHGLSNRLTGGPGAAGCLGNAEQMGEGWSDYLGLILTMKAGDQGTNARPLGDWLFNNPNGIRPFPYSTDMGINPHTYANSFSGTSQPHGIGSVWCMMTWEMTWGLIAQYGFDTDFYNGNGGNNIALQLVVEGLKLQPCSPGFVDGRDAILAADQALYNGANQCLIWNAFAKRGLGINADQGSSTNRSDGNEDFNKPTACGGTGCLLKVVGGNSTTIPYTASSNNILAVESDGNWSVATNASWITLNTANGSGNGTISFDAITNPAFTSRVDTIRITCTGYTLKFVVTQEARPCTQSYSPIPYSTGFESGSLDNFWCTTSSETEGRIRVTNLFVPRGTRHLLMDRTVSGNLTTNESKLGLQLAGASSVELKFWWKELNDETHPEDGVFLSDNGGATFAKVFDFTNGNPTYAEVTLNISQLAANNGLSLTNTFVIKFQQYDNFPADTDGIAIDDVSVQSATCTVGSPCNDNDPCTINDVYTSSCACIGTFEDTDNDGVCDANDQCPGYDDNLDYDGDGTPDGCDSKVFCGNCTATITNYPHIEDFEGGIGSICQYSGDDFDWTVNSNGTSSVNTGPDSAYQGVNYFYVESSSPNYPTKVTAFQSGCYDLSGSNIATINFWYHMYGITMGTLTLEGTKDQGANWSTIWSLSGDQGNNWFNANIDISSYTGGTFSYRFTGATTTSFTSDFSIDQITVDIGTLNCTPGSSCNDNDPCTINDVYTATCMCVGTFEDTDNDGVCDANDQCPGYDDNIDFDGDGTPDGCDQNVFCGNCTATISNYPHTEDFEAGIGSICQYTGEDFDWITRSDSTFSVNTGPDSAYQGLVYFYVESSIPNHPDKVSSFQSGCYDLSSAGSATIDFWYHMYGSTMGTLDLEVTTDQGDSWTKVWGLSGNQGDSWINATVSLGSYVGGTMSYRFIGNTSTSYTSDFALDQITVDVGMSECSPCTATITNYPHTEDFEAGIGSICQYNNDDFDWAVNSNGTTSLNTGPDSAYQGVNYFYVESSNPNYPSKVTVFQSGCYDLSSSNMATLNFWYHMYGLTMGTITLEGTTDMGDSWTTLWSLSGDQGNNWFNANIDLDSYTGGTFSYRFTAATTTSFTSDFALDQITVSLGGSIPSLTFDLKVALEGNYDRSLGTMNNDLYALELLPGMIFTDPNQPGTETPPGQPYNIPPWNYFGNEGQTYSNNDYDPTSVDWVLMSLRTGVDGNTEIHQAAGILKRDGSIEFLPGSAYQGNASGPYYVLIEHRNHMGAMSAQALTPQNGVLVYDFTAQDSWVSSNGGFGQKPLDPGYWGLYAGDGDQVADPVSYDINGADRIFWSMDNGIFNQYRGSDFNLSGEVSGADRILWNVNSGISSGVPK